MGLFDYAMDERGRIPLPPVYREAFRDGIVLSQAPDNCLRVYTKAAYEGQASQYTAESDLHRKGRFLRRSYFAFCQPVELDRQSRILIPPPMRKHAGLSKQALVVGAGDYLEIWNPEAWAEEARLIEENLEATLESTDVRRS
jgi:MraZ protein